MTEVCSTQDTLVVCIADSNSVLFSNLAPALHSFGSGDLGAVRITSGLLGSLGFDAEHGTVLEIAVTVWSTVFCNFVRIRMERVSADCSFPACGCEISPCAGS